ncbi:hypothetical protein L6452_05797 [Arctium lappa]|uniref:Uncharacterized protein n=1 Tax=Arctium lappa TaxID=4217 RepID=A0ACB9EGT6_ARCLA|nr:hypothetical protein L6452_05797 [Arctium lappa]
MLQSSPWLVVLEEEQKYILVTGVWMLWDALLLKEVLLHADEGLQGEFASSLGPYAHTISSRISIFGASAFAYAIVIRVSVLGSVGQRNSGIVKITSSRSTQTHSKGILLQLLFIPLITLHSTTVGLSDSPAIGARAFLELLLLCSFSIEASVGTLSSASS